jgi:hypothetical protein
VIDHGRRLTFAAAISFINADHITAANNGFFFAGLGTKIPTLVSFESLGDVAEVDSDGEHDMLTAGFCLVKI